LLTSRNETLEAYFDTVVSIIIVNIGVKKPA